MQLSKIANPPAFNRNLPYASIYGSGEGGIGASFCQHGHYYTGDGTYVGSDEQGARIGHVPPPRHVIDPGSRTVTEDEVEELLRDVRAGEIMNLALDTLAAMVASAGGPHFSGDNAHKLYTAWLLKFTG